jgi:hypothetical protein
MAITEPTADDVPERPNIAFVLDTGADYAQLSFSHLLDCGLPREGPSAGSVGILLADGSNTRGTMRDVNLWLFSNRPGVGPVCMESKVAITPDRGELARPVLGILPLLHAGLLIELDFAAQRFSVWI